MLNLENLKKRCFKKCNIYIILLNILVFSVIIINFIWLKKNKYPPVGNALQDLFPGINFYLDISNTKITYWDILNYFKYPALLKSLLPPLLSYPRDAFFVYPPLVPVSYALFYMIFGPGSGIELMANSIYLALALFAVYGIGKQIFDQKTGLLAAFIFSSFPGLISISREVYAEFIVMCLVALTLFLLLKTDFFRNRKYSLLLGFSLGLTALAKWEFVPAVLGPFILVLWKSNKTAKETTKERIAIRRFFINFCLAIALGIFVSSFWYFQSLQDIFWRLFFNPYENIFMNSDTTFDSRLFSVSTLTYYPLCVINIFIRFFYFFLLAFISAIPFYKIIRSRNRLLLLKKKLFYMVFLVSWIVIPYLCFTFIKINAPSHIMMILPAISIIISVGVFSFLKGIIRVSLVCLVILYGLSCHLHSFLLIKKIEPLHNLSILLKNDGRFSLSTKPGNYMRDFWEDRRFYPPHSLDLSMRMKKILSLIKKDSRNLKNKAVVLVLSPFDFVSSFQFQYYNLLGGYQLFIEPRGNDRSEFPPGPLKIDYCIIISEKAAFNKAAIKELIISTPNILDKSLKSDDFSANFNKDYGLVQTELLSDNLLARVYKFNKK